MKIRINKLHPDAVLPTYAHGPEEDAGQDLRIFEVDRAWHKKQNIPVQAGVRDGKKGYILWPGGFLMARTGLAFEIPAGYEMQIRPRSGLANKHGITLANSPATIDPGYRGEVGLGLVNHSKEPYIVVCGERVAQMIIARYEAVSWEESGLAESVRGTGGFGSSGK